MTEPTPTEPWIEMIEGDALASLRTLPDQSVHCIITSPPYFGLRDYGVDGQMGLEPTPAEFVAALVGVLREARRVLRDDGTLWLNLGDSYARNPAKGGSGPNGKHDFIPAYGDARKIIAANAKTGSSDGFVVRAARPGTRAAASWLKEKDLIGIPWRVAFALQADGWYLRQDIIWHKPNPMPESVTDRCTKAHEYIFLLSKSPTYYFDSAAMQEPAVKGAAGSTFHSGKTAEHQMGRSSEAPRTETGTRNKRSVWTVTTKPFKGAHFATFPPDLIEPCVLAGCPAGGTVLDPFFGAGTTGLVARKHRRNCIGIELNPAYYDLATQRLWPTDKDSE